VPRKRSTTRTLLEWGGLIVAALLIAFVIKTYLVEAFYIPSESMTPTLLVGDRVLVNKLSYDLHDVHRGDIVVFKAPPGEETAQIKDLVKRVVGLPGDTIEGRGGTIYINGKQLAEPYLPKGTESRTFAEEKVPAGHYFVLGDNRQNSKDSTYFGAIKSNLIVGRVFLRIWPLNRVGTL
jgi:signal peptidase I